MMPLSKHSPEHEPEVPTREDTPYVGGRLTVLLVGFMIVLSVLGMQLYKLTILRGPYYLDLSENNFIMRRPLIAPRGKILDRNGLPLAINHTLYDVEMSPYRLSAEQIEHTVGQLAALLGKPKIQGKAAEVISRRPRWKSVTLARNLTLAQVLPLRERAFELPGVSVIEHYQRHYPAGELTGHVTGHVGGISQKQWEETFQAKNYQPNETIGMLGLELTFEDLLHGQAGEEIVIRDARGQPRSSYPTQAARPGHTLTLTLDLGLQELAYRLLEGWTGSIVAMDPRTGAVLAMADRPGYDPNRPTMGHSFNKIVKGQFPPGSTFKVITASAGLRVGRDPNQTVFCGGYTTLPGSTRKFYCNWRPGHGAMNMSDALKKSCNVFFYQWAQKVGLSNLVETAQAYGFGEITGFELCAPGQEKPGKVGPATGEAVTLGNVLQMGIGQGALIDVTPIQMARAYSALCNGGRLLRPRIIQSIQTPEGEIQPRIQPDEQGRLPMSAHQLQLIKDALWRVAHEQGGTASRAGLKEEWKVAGKTGTAEIGGGYTPHAWFACYAPADDPQIVLVILVERSGHGGQVAAPLARQLLAYFFGQPELEIVPPPKEEKPAQEEED